MRIQASCGAAIWCCISFVARRGEGGVKENGEYYNKEDSVPGKTAELRNRRAEREGDLTTQPSSEGEQVFLDYCTGRKRRWATEKTLGRDFHSVLGGGGKKPKCRGGRQAR